MKHNPKRYLLDDSDLDLNISLALYKTALTWASKRSDRFVLSLQPSAYDRPDDIAQYLSLGKVIEKQDIKPKDDLFSRLVEKCLGKEPAVVQVEGEPDERFVRKLTGKGAPMTVVSGDLCPVEDVLIMAGERTIYALYDYGRDQILDLEDEELASLQEALGRAALDPNRVIPAPAGIGD